VLVEVVEEETEEEAGKEAGPSTGGAAPSRTPQEGSTGLPSPVQAPQAQPVAGAAVPVSSSATPPAGVRTRGQLASEAQRTRGGPLAKAPRSTWPAGGPTARPPQAAPGGSDRPGPRPLVPLFR
jgi:hypothetical protein